jgi:sugar O-acyltransferase (sialic acid O-acetyltransferase NeuD family)
MKQIIIFGNKDLAQLAKYYFDNDKDYADYQVVAFTVDSEYRDSNSYEGLPLVDFENLENAYNPRDYLLFAPMTGAKMNKTRESVYKRGIQKGYKFCSYISSKATIFNNEIGDNCFILEDNTIQPFTKIGNNVVMWSGNHIGHHSVIEDNVFFTSHVVMSGHCNIGRNSWLGVNCTLRDGLKIGDSTLIAMGSLVTKNTETDGFYMGAPAKLQNKRSFEVY